MFLTLESVPSLEMGSCVFHRGLVIVLDEVQVTGAWDDGHPFRLGHSYVGVCYAWLFCSPYLPMYMPGVGVWARFVIE